MCWHIQVAVDTEVKRESLFSDGGLYYCIETLDSPGSHSSYNLHIVLTQSQQCSVALRPRFNLSEQNCYWAARANIVVNTNVSDGISQAQAKPLEVACRLVFKGKLTGWTVWGGGGPLPSFLSNHSGIIKTQTFLLKSFNREWLRLKPLFGDRLVYWKKRLNPLEKKLEIQVWWGKTLSIL